MAKKAKPEDQKEDCLELQYSLHQLPSAQHKTGLAGLVFLLQTMEERKMQPLPEIIPEGEGVWKFRFTRDGFQALFDELYDAEIVEVESLSKWANKDCKEIRERKTLKGEKEEIEKVYVYEVEVPKGAALKGALPDDGEGGKKLALWRDMLWATYCGKPAARGVYKERLEGRPSSKAGGAWNDLQKKREGSASLSGSLMLGAEGISAEGVAYKGTVGENFLLQFAHLASPLFVTRTFQVKRGKKDESSTYSVKWEEGGFVLVMPEIIDIEKYVEKYRKWLGSPSKPAKIRRPLSSLIDLPEESGLEFLSAIAGRRTEVHGRGVFDAVEGVEYFYMEKRGNAVNLVASAHIPLGVGALNEYNRLVAPAGDKRPLNFLYKACRVRNLLYGNPWHEGMQTIFEQFPNEFFIWSKQGSPKNTPFFGLDAGRKLREIATGIMILTEEKNMDKNSATTPAIGRDDRLAAKTRAVVRQYVISELKERASKYILSGKTHLERKKEDGDMFFPAEYQKEVQKICSGAFLALRGRKGPDIAEYFTGTLCSHPQFMLGSPKNEEGDEFLLLAKSLVDPEEREKIKLFAMLALSACSYVRIKDDQAQAEEE
ncbi:MAG: type I-MYXAN CRISPR-associated protein Cmx8 [Aminivibrio sp.]|nr:type I-MYXAN CRISPR-associated protein Cmx8 [Synergistaceae bacterium]